LAFVVIYVLKVRGFSLAAHMFVACFFLQLRALRIQCDHSALRLHFLPKTHLTGINNKTSWNILFERKAMMAPVGRTHTRGRDFGSGESAWISFLFANREEIIHVYMYPLVSLRVY